MSILSAMYDEESKTALEVIFYQLFLMQFDLFFNFFKYEIILLRL